VIGRLDGSKSGKLNRSSLLVVNASVMPTPYKRSGMCEMSISLGSVSAVASKRISLSQVKSAVISFGKLHYILSVNCCD
jgi:hypothetical protein